MSDIVERLRAWSPLVVSEFSVPAPAMAMDDAAAEIERLRARVEVLETALRYYAEDNYNGYNATGACARAALEAKP